MSSMGPADPKVREAEGGGPIYTRGARKADRNGVPALRKVPPYQQTTKEIVQ